MNARQMNWTKCSKNARENSIYFDFNFPVVSHLHTTLQHCNHSVLVETGACCFQNQHLQNSPEKNGKMS